MLTIDIVGLLLTIIFIGLRYPHYVVFAAVIHELGRIIMVLFLHGNIESVVAAGIFGSTVANNFKEGSMYWLVIFNGPLANYIVSATAGGIEFEKTAHLINPFKKLAYPFAVINLRFAIISLLINLKVFFGGGTL